MINWTYVGETLIKAIAIIAWLMIFIVFWGITPS